ncbi:hypothetical protein [Spirillospora sp. NPDC047279]|uniref:hypothetical protein n=1 Tax=Spirillospora sp. NPDC047279 TaxID=3155478 RepID=UPI00340DEE8D
MYSFYVFEDSFFQGGGGWGGLTVASKLPEIEEAVDDVLRTGWNLNSSATLDIRTYQQGVLSVERDLYRFLRLEIPGLSEIRWDADRRILGGTPLAGGPLEWVTEDLEAEEPEDLDERMWVLLDETLLRDGEYKVTVDWKGLQLPELTAPLLPEGTGVELDDEDDELEYGFNDLL